MNRRIRNVILFLGTLMGTALLILGIKGMVDGEANAWMYILGAVFAYALAITPGRRLRAFK